MNCNFVSCLKTIRRIDFNSLFVWATSNRFTIYHLLENIHNVVKELTVLFMKNMPTKLNIKLLWDTLLLSPYIEYTDIDIDKNIQYLTSIEGVIQDAIEHIIEDLNEIPETIEKINEESEIVQLSNEQSDIIELENDSNKRQCNSSNKRQDTYFKEHKSTSFFPLRTEIRKNNNKCCFPFRRFITLFRFR